MIKDKDMELVEEYILAGVLYMKDNFKMIIIMDMEGSYGVLLIIIKENLKIVYIMGKVSKYIQMEQLKKVFLKMGI
jgi:hypothetical protein